MTASPLSLASLGGLRSAPDLDPDQRQVLRRELQAHLEACDWCTLGVMAPSATAAVEALRSLEAALGWAPLEADPASGTPELIAGPVFLKGNQNNGRFLLRPEPGLGEGLLITGHCGADPGSEGTWGPFPLNFFSP